MADFFQVNRAGQVIPHGAHHARSPQGPGAVRARVKQAGLGDINLFPPTDFIDFTFLSLFAFFTYKFFTASAEGAGRRAKAHKTFGYAKGAYSRAKDAYHRRKAKKYGMSYAEFGRPKGSGYAAFGGG